MICPDCKGSGTYTGLTVVEPCRTCNGAGSVRDGGEERGRWFWSRSAAQRIVIGPSGGTLGSGHPSQVGQR